MLELSAEKAVLMLYNSCACVTRDKQGSGKLTAKVM